MRAEFLSQNRGRALSAQLQVDQPPDDRHLEKLSGELGTLQPIFYIKLCKFLTGTNQLKLFVSFRSEFHFKLLL